MAYTNIDDPSAHFQTALYTGNAGNQTITNDGNSDLQPDFVWLKSRTFTSVHLAQDSTRGATGGVYRYLQPDNTAAEAVQTDGDGITSLNSDGFSLGFNNSNSWNQSGNTYVAWQWKANGGTTSSNTDGTITTTVQANPTAGFSIATWTGNGTNGATIGHGNGGIPNGYIVKRLDTAADWGVGGGYTGNVWVGGTSAVMHLNTAVAVSEAYNNYWGSSFPNNQILPLSQNAEINASGGSYVGYFFRSIQGYSKLGRYKSNGSADGPFVYTGFKPAFVIIKSADTAKPWVMKTAAISENPINEILYPDLSNAEGSDGLIDFVSNGFKVREGPDANINNSLSSTYIYMAFAENPFTTSTGIPTTAR
jgi:hypothetical protein